MSEKHNQVERDERTIAVENASYSMGFKLTMYALLLDIVVRSYFLREPSWDLFAVIILCSLIPTLYQLKHGVLTRSWAKTSIIGVGTAIVAAIVIALIKSGLF